MKNKIVFIGAGSMAEAIISGITKSHSLTGDQILVTNKSNIERLKRLEQAFGIQYFQNKEVIREADIVVLATKPYDMKEAIESTKDYIQPNQFIISVIAGMETEYISTLIGKDNPIIRAMPNTSASIGASATAISAGKFATTNHLQLAKSLFDTIGKTVIVDESDMHAVTSISGSGPAYVYYFVEAMEKAACEVGLDATMAKELIIQTMVGAGEMLKDSGQSATALRKKVTSPAGTTQAGIEVLDKHGFQQTILECVKSARDRSLELGKPD